MCIFTAYGRCGTGVLYVRNLPALAGSTAVGQVTIGPRRDAELAAEDPAEMGLVREPAGLGDAGKGVAGGGQQMHGLKP